MFCVYVGAATGCKAIVGGRRIATYRLVHEMMREGKLDLRGLLTHTFPLEDYRKAFALAMRRGPGRAVKVAFDFRSPGASATRPGPTSWS